MSLTYTIKKDGEFLCSKTFTKSRRFYKKHKLFSRVGWVGYSMFYVGKVKYELFAEYPSVLK